MLDVLDASTAPAVDRLVIVAHGHQLVLALAQQAQPGVLNGVGILKLVHQHIAETFAVVLEQLGGAVAQQFQCPQQQFAKIDHATSFTGLFVGFIDPNHHRLERIARPLDVGAAQAFVLLAINEPLKLTCRPATVIQIHLLAQTLDQAQLVVAVHDLEVVAQPGIAPVGTQQPVRQTMEGAHPHAVGVDPQQVFDSPAHLPGRLVGKGHSHD